MTLKNKVQKTVKFLKYCSSIKRKAMIKIKKIEGIEIKAPKWWKVLIFVIIIYGLISGDYRNIMEILKNFVLAAAP